VSSAIRRSIGGNGSSSIGTIVDAGSGIFIVLGTHTYRAAGTPTFTVQVSKLDGEMASATGTATVTGGPNNTGGPQNLVTKPVAASAGQTFMNVTLAAFADSDPGVSPSDFTAAVDWGDGLSTPNTTVRLDGARTFNVLGTHTYNAAGSYPVAIQVTDNKGPRRRPPAPSRSPRPTWGEANREA
jgi:hypothetical protein